MEWKWRNLWGQGQRLRGQFLGGSVLLMILLMGVGELTQAKDLSSRLGIGFRNSYSIELPSLAAVYYPNNQLGLLGAVGIDTQDQNSRIGLSLGLRHFIFREENLNFFAGGQLALLTVDTGTSSGSSTSGAQSGIELGALVGVEFFLSGLENLGFNFEAGVTMCNLGKIRFRTFGDSFLRSGMFFYF